MNITGTASADVLNGTAQADVIQGGAGNDTINGGTGDDTISGGDDNDTFIQDQFGSSGDTINGGLGTDIVEFRTSATPIDSLFGPLTAYSMAGANALVSIERIQFASTATHGVQVTINTAAAATLMRATGGAGRDVLTISTGTAAGAFTMPALSTLSWSAAATNAWEHSGDLIALSSSAPAGSPVALTAASGVAFMQLLSGGADGDVLTGSANADMFDASLGGDVVQAGGGNDMIMLVNTVPALVGGFGPLSVNSGAGGVYDGGAGTDVLSIGGPVTLQAVLIGIEGIQLQAPLIPASANTALQPQAVLTLDSEHVTMLAANTFFTGTGLVVVRLDNWDSFNGSQYTFTAGSAVSFAIVAGYGDGVSITGTATNDFIQFGYGVQTASGGAGADVFSPGGGVNTVADFQVGIDKISLENTGVSSLSRLSDFMSDSAAGVGFSIDSGGYHWEAHLTGVTMAQLGPQDLILNPGTAQVIDLGSLVADYMYGFGLDDLLDAGEGNDRIYTGGGLDVVLAGAGDDLIVLDGDATPGSTIDGGAGADVALLRANAAARQSADGMLTTYNLLPGLASGSGLGGIEKVQFDSAAGTALTLIALRGAGVTELVGGDGRDGFVAVVTTGGSHDLSALTLTGWNKAAGGDRLTLMADQSLTAAVTLTARSDTASQTLIGAQGNDTLNGSAFDDELIGGAGNDLLIGNGGADSLHGGLGNDTIRISSQFALVFEQLGEGTDTVESSAHFYLYANIENLVLTGSANLFGVGNELDNTIVGNAGSNLLIANEGNDMVSGAGGADTLYGMSGNDTLNGDEGNDTLVGGSGNDTLGGGNGADALYGEDGNDVLDGGSGFDTDVLVGGAGNDVLNGISGQANPDYDQLDGGTGDDTYWIDTGADLTYEAANGGTDTVHADIKVAGAGAYLYANVENLVLEGSTAFGVGNGLANQLTGNSAANLLLGGAGNDTLGGKLGNDVLFGEGGADTFLFEAGTGSDVIGDFARGTDKISLIGYGLDFAAVQSRFVQVGNHGGIQLANGDVIVLHNVTMSQLTASDFIFG